MCGTGTRGMYLLSTLRGLSGPTALTAKSQILPTSLKVWHRHFGHASMKAIKTVLAQNLVNGLVIKGDLTVPGLCEDYIYGKHACQPYDTEVKPEGSSNKCTYIDLWGLLSILSLEGATYMMVAVDEGTSHISVYFLTQKNGNTMLTAFTTYHT